MIFIAKQNFFTNDGMLGLVESFFNDLCVLKMYSPFQKHFKNKNNEILYYMLSSPFRDLDCASSLLVVL